MEEPAYAPHETRMLSLQCAIDYTNGDAKRGNHYTSDEIVAVAKKFEAYLTAKPIEGYVAKPRGANDV